jgi:hypothetical protein
MLHDLICIFTAQRCCDECEARGWAQRQRRPDDARVRVQRLREQAVSPDVDDAPQEITTNP